MKKIMMIAAMMVATLTASAQKEAGSFSVKPMVGINFANVTDLNDNKMKVGLVAGAEGLYMFTEDFGVSAGLLYSQQGTKLNYDILGADVTIKMNNDYLNIPVLANVYITKGLAVKLGVQPGFKVRSEVSGKASYNGESVKDSESFGKVKSFDFSIPVGLSYEISNIVLDARYNWGLTKIFDVDGTKSKNSVFMLTLGYKFDL